MKISQLFSHTLREPPSQAVLSSHKLLCRAGYVQEIGVGNFALLPLGRLALQQIENTFLSFLGAQPNRLDLPLLQSHEGSLPQNNGLHFNDSQGRQLQLVSNLESAFTELIQQHLSSYRQLPVYLSYHGPLWQNQVHPGSGIFYSRMPQIFEVFAVFDSDEGNQNAYAQMVSATLNLLRTCQVPFIQALGASTQSKETLEWYLPHPAGKSTVFSCSKCSYTASSAAARYIRQAPWQEELLGLEKVYTPDCKTIDALAKYLQVPQQRTAKAVFVVANQAGKENLVVVVIPGDRELDENRLACALNASSIRPASEDEIIAAGIVPGYGSPIGIENVFVVVDPLIPLSPNLVAGANETGFHYVNVNYGRDFSAQLIAEITQPKSGDCCPDCAGALETLPAVLLASLRQNAIEHTVMDPQGKMQPVFSINYRILTTRLLAAIAESQQDEHGLILPAAAAPCAVHIVLLQDKEGQAEAQAEEIYNQLKARGVLALYDNRSERAGVKFNDADLIGIPIRITVSGRSIAQGAVELKLRQESNSRLIPLTELIDVITEML